VHLDVLACRFLFAAESGRPSVSRHRLRIPSKSECTTS